MWCCVDSTPYQIFLPHKQKLKLDLNNDLNRSSNELEYGSEKFENFRNKTYFKAYSIAWRTAMNVTQPDYGICGEMW